LVVLSSDFSVLWVSASVERIYGYRPADLIGRSAATLVHADALDVSIGRASWQPSDTPEESLRRADASMYEQKSVRRG
jgi:PAS domain S-box-containing protein